MTNTTLLAMGIPTIISIVVGCVIAVIIIVLCCIFVPRKRFLYNAQNLRKNYTSAHTQLTSDCQSCLTRLETLGKNSDYYNGIYLNKKKAYDDLLERKDQRILEELNSIDSMIASKKTHELKEIVESTNSEIEAFINSVSVFSSDLSILLQEDNEVHSASVSVKAKHREVKDFYVSHQTELSDLSKSFQSIIDTSEAGINEYRKLTDQAKYKEAKDKLNELDQILSATIKVMGQIPLLQASISTVIPNKLDDLENTYHDMLNEGYVIEYLDVENKVMAMRNAIAVLKSNLTFLDINGAQEKIDEIQTEITDLNSAFQEEEKAKKEFINSQNHLAESTFTIEKNYSRHINSLNEYQSTYILDNKYVEQIHSLKVDVENIGILKRELDSYLDTSNRQPYTLIMKKMSEMRSEITKAERTMKDYSAYLDSLKNSIIDVFQGLRVIFVNLRTAQNGVRLLGVESYIQSVKPKFDHYFNKIAEIDSMLKVLPLDVNKIHAAFSAMRDECGFFINDVNENLKKAEKAEQAIVYGNSIRLEFSDCNDYELKAEKAFSEGDFSRANDNAVSAIEIWRTNLNKQN